MLFKAAINNELDEKPCHFILTNIERLSIKYSRLSPLTLKVLTLARAHKLGNLYFFRYMMPAKASMAAFTVCVRRRHLHADCQV